MLKTCISLITFPPFFFLLLLRFLFVLLGPKGKAKSYHEIGRAIATLMSDEVHYDYVTVTFVHLLFLCER